MGALVLFNLLKRVEEKDKMQGLPRNLLLFAPGMVVIR